MPLHGTNGRHRVYLMGQGEVRYFDDGGRPVDPRHVELTERGRAQAGAAAAALAEVPIDQPHQHGARDGRLSRAPARGLIARLHPFASAGATA